jgi:phosphatidylglycerol:prolipoprotein diacylglycerol transferase
METLDLSQWYHHDLNPIAIQWGTVFIPWYWLVYVAGWFWCVWVFKKTKPLMTESADDQSQSDFLLWGWIALIVGARIVYIVFYNFNYFVEHPDQIFSIWNGGMSFHGGFLAIALTALLISHKKHISVYSLTDPVAMGIPLILALGRLANFANGELPGRISTVPWAVVFPAPFDGAPRHPSQLYEAVFEGVLVGLLLFFNRRRLLAQPGATSLAFTAFYAAGRFIVEFTREPDPQIGLIWGLSMGQWLCVVMLLAAIIAAMRLRHMDQTT